MKNKTLLIYGAYGYSGEMMIHEALKNKIKPIIAGRDFTKTEAIAKELNLEFRVFDVKNASKYLDGIDVLLNCAGPFSLTAESMVKACLEKQVHYLDITGEIEVFRKCHAFDSEAKKQNVVILPGVGFDVVPTDCLALMLKEKMPDAKRIDLAFSFESSVSIGTAKTITENLGKGGMIRQNHELKAVGNAYKFRKIQFANKPQWAVSIPWGDVFTAGVTTGVPDGLVYMAFPKALIYGMKVMNPIKGIFDIKIAQKILKFLLEKFMAKGPNLTNRQRQKSQLWGEAENERGDIVSMTIIAQNAYTLTAEAGIKIAKHCLENDLIGGYYTPAKLLGSGFVKELSEVEVR